ncbi:MAG: scpA [Bacillales bacterium]|jgi:segregation and condensation protein A|nr:scpA [Bacillales bacterium]
MEEYKVKVEAFEGPLDLLLHLVQKMEIDIYDIPVSEITEQYLFYVNTMQELELNVASEYLVMAATLIAMKSKTLLPVHEELLDTDEYVEEDDPREALIMQLVEYKKYKEISSTLKEKEIEQSFVYTKPASDITDYAPKNLTIPSDLNITFYDLLGAFQKVVIRKKFSSPLQTKIMRQEITLEERMEEILELVQSKGDNVDFTELFEFQSKGHLVVTFLAVLELIKLKKISVFQDNNFTSIYIMSNYNGGY